MNKVFLTLAISCMTLTSQITYATPFSYNVTNDVYDNNTPNGIPTAKIKFPNNDLKPDIVDAFNAILGTSYTKNEQLDPYFVANDQQWSNLNGGISVIGYSVGYQNTLGIYNDSMKNNVINDQYYFGAKYDNADDGVYDSYQYTAPNNTFYGWYLESINGAGNKNYYYSEESRNPDGKDHMMTFSLGKNIIFDNGVSEILLKNAYLITWEDKEYGHWDGTSWYDGTATIGDDDYNDLMFLVDAAPTTVPEPGTMILFGSGLLCLVGTVRKKIIWYSRNS